MEIDKLIANLEYLHSKGTQTIKLVFCNDSIKVKKLLDEIKLCDNSM